MLEQAEDSSSLLTFLQEQNASPLHRLVLAFTLALAARSHPIEEIQKYLNESAHQVKQLPPTTEESLEDLLKRLAEDIQKRQQELSSTKSKKRTRGPHRTPIAPIAKGKEMGMITSQVVTMEIVKGLLSPETFKAHEDKGIAEHFHRFSQEQGQLIITIRPQDGEGWSEVMTAIQTLGSECVDTFCAVIMLAVELNGVEHVRTPFLISPDDILEYCGKKKQHGSFSAGQRAKSIKCLKTLSQAKVIATFPKKGPGKRGRKRKGAPATDSSIIRVEGSLLHLLNFKIGEYSTITGDEIWEKRSLAVGEWVAMAPGLNQQTAIMLRQVLAYSAKSQVYQKEIGRYLTFMFRVNAHKPDGVFECSMKVLLNAAGIKVPREIGDFKEAIEHALACLKQDNVIGEYAQVVEASPTAQEIQATIHEHAKGWWDYYAAVKWRFHPPQYARDQYKGLLKRPK